VSVFIGFGGSRAENVATRFEIFLKTNTDIETFLASPQSRTMPSTANFRTEIQQHLINCNIAVFVCHKNTSHSQSMKDEIDTLFSENLENKIISFAASDTCIPKKIRDNKWHPLHFPPEEPEESFRRLLNEIYRCYLRLQNSERTTTERAEMIRQ